ncbi:hypothetical protein ACFPOI_27980 [Nonomuraea angiospora]|uniref:Uncharacterized protein n=1 Tax=Nonomuraea angiospora TaxID=46172 RepID=A0ABR9LNU5_9ACTN|nr:hypothetical protein [Nonomuraea angiospora]MBE1582105.1 hypothetical protein [Nonomuraea angiospora]
MTAVVGCAVLVPGPELAGGAAPVDVDVTGVALAALAGLSYAATRSSAGTSSHEDIPPMR